MNRLGGWALVGCIVVAGCGGVPAGRPASGAPRAAIEADAAFVSTSPTVADPSADAWTHAGRRAPGYLDLVGAEVTREDDGTFSFVATLAAAVPATWSVHGTGVGWAACINVSPFVVSPLFGQLAMGPPCQFIAETRWSGTGLSGELLDRRSVGAAEPPAVLSFDPVVDGTSVRMSLPAAALGDPTWFAWSMYSEDLGALGTSSTHHVDAIPDTGVGGPLAWSAD